MLCQLGIPMDTVLAAARQTDGIFCLNAAPAKPLPQALLNRTDILIVNESEHQVFGGQLDGFSGTCVVTLGSKGATAIRDEQIRDPIPTPRRLQRQPGAETHSLITSHMDVSASRSQCRSRLWSRGSFREDRSGQATR